MTIYATYFNSSIPQSVGNNQVVVLSVTEVARNSIRKVLYLDTLSTYSASLYPFDASETANKQLFLFSLGVSGLANGWTVTGPELFSTSGTVSFNNLVATFTTSTQLSPGYYYLQVKFDADPRSQVRLIFQSDPYACFHPQAFADYYSNFPGCIHSNSPNVYPCSVFNQVLQRCEDCVPGFILDNGRCLFNTTCPDRNWYNRGTCTPIGDNCEVFEYFTGICTKCFDELNYEIISGVCVQKQVTCGERQWKLNSVCYDVSELCGNFDPTNGWCTTCKDDTLYQLNSDGTCTLRVVTCSLNFYKDGLECIPIPATCSSFDETLKVCTICIRGYQPQNGACVRYSCPDRMVPHPF